MLQKIYPALFPSITPLVLENCGKELCHGLKLNSVQLLTPECVMSIVMKLRYLRGFLLKWTWLNKSQLLSCYAFQKLNLDLLFRHSVK